jgi:hypothetical protein
MEMLPFLPYLLGEGGGEEFQDVVIGSNFPRKTTLLQKIAAGMDKFIVLHLKKVICIEKRISRGKSWPKTLKTSF